MKVNFVSATLSKRVEELGSKIMEKYVTVGFGENSAAPNYDDEKEIISSIPKQTQQYYMEVPT